MLAGDRPRAGRAARDDRVLDCAMLPDVLLVQLVDLRAPGPPLAQERPPRAFRRTRDLRCPGGLVDHVVESIVGAHPLAGQAQPLALRTRAVEQRRRHLREPRLRVLERGQPFVVDQRRRELGRERLQLGPYEEGLAELVARDLTHAHAAIGDERDEPGRGEPAQCLAHGRPADLELLRELLLAEDGAGRDLARDDRVLQGQRDLVCFRPVLGVCQWRNCADSVEPSRASVEDVPWLTAEATRSK